MVSFDMVVDETKQIPHHEESVARNASGFDGIAKIEAMVKDYGQVVSVYYCDVYKPQVCETDSCTSHRKAAAAKSLSPQWEKLT